MNAYSPRREDLHAIGSSLSGQDCPVVVVGVFPCNKFVLDRKVCLLGCRVLTLCIKDLLQEEVRPDTQQVQQQ